MIRFVLVLELIVMCDWFTFGSLVYYLDALLANQSRGVARVTLDPLYRITSLRRQPLCTVRFTFGSLVYYPDALLAIQSRGVARVTLDPLYRITSLRRQPLCTVRSH